LSLLRQIREGPCDISEIRNEQSIVISKTQETSYTFDSSGGLPRLDCSNFFRVHAETFANFNKKSKIFNRFAFKLAFINIQLQSSLLKPLQYQFDLMSMILKWSICVDECVIKVRGDEFIQILAKRVVDVPLERSRTIRKTKRGY